MPVILNRLRYMPTEGFAPPGVSVERTGRERRRELPAGSIWVGRGSALASPFHRSEHGDAALDMFRDYLRDKVRRRDPAILAALREIKEGSSLVCSCAPKPCHSDILLAAWTAMRDDGRFGIPDERDPEIAADVPWRQPDPESEDLQWRMQIACTELRERGVNPDRWQRTALLRFFDEHCAAAVRDAARRAAEAKHPMEPDDA